MSADHRVSAVPPVIATPTIVDGRTLTPACWWSPQSRAARARAPGGGPHVVVWHWTAGERRAERVCETLRARGLSIHYVIDADGRIVQCADHETVTYHAGGVNGRSIGVEVVSRGVAGDTIAKGRERVIARVHKREIRAVSWTPAQASSIVSLAAWLSDRHGIPRTVPAEARVIPATDLLSWRGHIEHCHVTATKVDCAGLAADLLAAHGWGRR